MGTLIAHHGTEIMTYIETVPSWFLLNLKVSKLRETYYSWTTAQDLSNVRNPSLEKESELYNEWVSWRQFMLEKGILNPLLEYNPDILKH